MGPSGIRRNRDIPVRTRTLQNGAVVVENAYEGTLYYGDVEIAQIKGLKTPSNTEEIEGVLLEEEESSYPSWTR